MVIEAILSCFICFRSHSVTYTILSCMFSLGTWQPSLSVGQIARSKERLASLVWASPQSAFLHFEEASTCVSLLLPGLRAFFWVPRVATS